MKSLFFSRSLFIFFFIPLLAVTASAQDFQHFSIGVNGSLELPLEEISGTRIQALGYTAGVNLHYRLNRRWSFQSGINVRDYVYKRVATIDNSDVMWVNPPPAPHGLKWTKKTLMHSYFMDIPARIYYTIGSKKIRMITSVGLNTEIGMKAKRFLRVKYEADGHEETNSHFYNYRGWDHRVLVASTVSIGALYELSSGWFIRCEPVYQHIIGYDSYEHSLGLNISVNMPL
jgi:hypothetical protein